MADLNRAADLYESLLAEAKKLPPLFDALPESSRAFVKVNQSASLALREAADATYKRMTDVLIEVEAHIKKTETALQELSATLGQVEESRERIQELRDEISDAISG